MALVTLSASPRRRIDVLSGGRSNARVAIMPLDAAREERRARNTVTTIQNERHNPHAGELHRTEIGDVVMILRETGDVVLYKKATGKNRVVLTTSELDDLAVALDEILGARRHKVRP